MRCPISGGGKMWLLFATSSLCKIRGGKRRDIFTICVKRLTKRLVLGSKNRAYNCVNCQNASLPTPCHSARLQVSADKLFWGSPVVMKGLATKVDWLQWEWNTDAIIELMTTLGLNSRVVYLKIHWSARPNTNHEAQRCLPFPPAITRKLCPVDGVDKES